MFSFHKPKVYRSVTGCCICKAKSSSSRFTDSTKYEDDFHECFKLEERRNGEICNACVLLIKRYKKLPPDSDRNWAHVVDARAGPGMKSLTKFKAKKKRLTAAMKDANIDDDKIIKKKHVWLKPEREESPTMSDEMNDDDNASKSSSRSGSPDDCDDIAVIKKRFKCGKKRRVSTEELSPLDFIDLTYFKRTRICCGVIFKGQYGEVIIDQTLFKPCPGCLLRSDEQNKMNNLRKNIVSTAAIDSFHSSSVSPAHSTSSSSSSPAHSVDSTTTDSPKQQPGKTFSDSSSDSGYDESSNQGIIESKIHDNNIKNSSTKKSTAVTTTVPINKQTKNIILQPGKKLQLKPTPITPKKLNETVRLQSDLPIKLIPIKQVDKFTCKPLVSSSTKQNNSLVDFAIHTSRQSVTN